MHKGLLILLGLSFICGILQFLPIIAVPITGKAIGYNLYLSKYQDYAFGVYGICNIKKHRCSRPKIGYPSESDDYYSFVGENKHPSFGGAELPSKARYTISKLLVVHLIGFSLSCLSVLVIGGLIFILWIEETGLKCLIKSMVADKMNMGKGRKINNSSSDITESTLATKISSAPEIASTSVQRQDNKRDITLYLNSMLIISLLSFLLTLLAFLADILLFTPHLSYLGWIQLCPIILLSVMISMLCFIKRSITSRKYLNDDNTYNNDDMRTRKNVGVLHWNDSDSDDGFYVYTNGFYSNYNNEDTYREGNTSANQPFLNNSTQSGWVRHDPYNELSDDISINSSSDISINSSRANSNTNGEAFEMTTFNEQRSH